RSGPAGRRIRWPPPRPRSRNDHGTSPTRSASWYTVPEATPSPPFVQAEGEPFPPQPVQDIRSDGNGTARRVRRPCRVPRRFRTYFYVPRVVLAVQRGDFGLRI